MYCGTVADGDIVTMGRVGGVLGVGGGCDYTLYSVV